MAFFTASKINNMKTAYRNGDLEKALSYADRLLPADVHTAYDLTVMADIYLESERYVAAKRVFAELYKKNQSTRLCKQLIDLNIRTDCLDKAIEYVAELKKLDEDDYERYIYQYRIGKAMEQPDEYLIQNLMKVKEADYINVWALELAKLFFKTGQLDECQKECRNIILWFPETEYSRKALLLIEACRSGAEYDEIIQYTQPKESMPDFEKLDEGYTEIDEEEYADAAQSDDLAYTEVPPVSGGEEDEEYTESDEEYTESDEEEDYIEINDGDEDGYAEPDDEAAEDEDDESTEILMEREEDADDEEPEAEEDEEKASEESDESEEEVSADDEEEPDDGSEDADEAGEKAEEHDYEEMPIYDPFDGDELPEIDFLEGAGISAEPEKKKEPAEKKEVEAAVKETEPKEEKHVPSQNTIIRDALADEVMKALQAQEEGSAKPAGEHDDVDASIMKMLQEL